MDGILPATRSGFGLTGLQRGDQLARVLEPAVLSAIAYRPDIDGLRAIAVVSVIGYHYGLPVPGGFAGVDIFFVISGYLITAMLVRDVEAGRLSILSFYDRRIRRIVPALLGVMAATLLAGFVLLWPGDYATLGWSALYSAFGAGNLYFLLHTGYFDQTADLQPLLHLWSLGVEEQFYLVWPLLLLAAGRFTRSRPALLGLTAAILAASLGYAAFILPLDPKAAFYLPTTRAWELAMGAALVVLPRLTLPALVRNLAALAGLALLGGWLFVLTDTMAFPGLAAVPACLGAALLIWACEQPTAVGAALSFRPLRFVGKISYSLYLWHWPVLVLYRHFSEGRAPAPLALVVLFGLAVALSWLSYRFVEQPFRRVPWVKWKTISAGVAAAALVAATGAGLGVASGIPARVSAQMRSIAGLEVMWRWQCPARKNIAELEGSFCLFGADWDSAPTKVFVWGDSSVEQLAPLLQTASSGRQAGLMLYRECPAFISDEVKLHRPDEVTYNSDCAHARERAESYLTSHPEVDVVILAALWTPTLSEAFTRSVPAGNAATGATLMKQSLVALVDRIGSPGRRIYLFADMPILEGPPANFCAFPKRRLPLRRPCDGDDLTLTTAAFRQHQTLTYATVQGVADATDAVVPILPGNVLCGPSTCTTVLDGIPIYRDRAHLRRNLPTRIRQKLSTMLGLDLIFSGN